MRITILNVTYVNLFTNRQHTILAEPTYLDYFRNLPHINVISFEEVSN